MTYHNKINILMVDDRPENLLALEAVLANPNYNLVRATSGEQALKFLLKDEFAIILLDVQMPGLSGFETAQMIKSREKTKDIPIIFITAINKEPEHVFTGYSVGAIDYLFKPFEPENLKAKISNFVDMYTNNKRITDQAKLLKESTRKLENANKELKRVAAELRKTEAMARVIRDTAIDTMITFDQRGQILTVNPAIKGMFGYEESELIDGNVVSIIPTLSEKKFNHLFSDNSLDRKNFLRTLIEVKGMKKGDLLFPAEIQIGEANIEGQVIFACIIRDITERKEQLATLKYQALHDSLTALPNRAFLYECIQQSIGQNRVTGENFSLLIFDLDHFKAINDTLGHHYGDLLLKRVSSRLEVVAREQDTVARLGGDEFALLVNNCDSEKAATIANQIIQAIERPIDLNEQTLMIRPSVGVSVFPNHGDDVETLVKRADIAMYTAKRTGSGYAIYSTDSDPNSLNHLQLIGELRESIETNQLKVHYQPKVDMKTEKIYEAEALVRWENPTYGYIPPHEFIAIAEQNGLIKALTLWVLNASLRQVHEWRNEGLNIRVAVNLSTRNLQDVMLPDQVEELLRRWDVPASSLILEITESFIMANPKRAMEVLLKLKDMGIKLSIDDFGTGYSSLAYLKNLPVDEIKVDKSFVIDMAKDPNDAMIVRSVISLAHNLGIAVVAEGVETKEIWDTLASLECDSAQGYLISRPISAPDFTKFFQERQHGMVF